jgi:protein-disulfide isomerase/uncharacterized membrane protein
MTKPLAKHHRRAAAVLLVLGLATAGLAIYQWWELHLVESGVRVACALSASVNCETVWTSPFAQSLHQALGMPVAALGLLWGLVATACAGWLLLRALSAQPVRDFVGATRVTAAVGVVATAGFVAASVSAGALCLTCLGTYLLVSAYAVVAMVALPRPLFPRAGEWWTALGLPTAVALLAYAVLLVPGRSAPQPSPLAHVSAKPGGLEAFLAEAAPAERQALSDNLALWRLNTAPSTLPPARNLLGEASAPVKLVEWTDIRCGHCRHFNEVVEGLRAVLPPGSLSVEARNLPLDGLCNPFIPQTAAGVSCDGALALICLEKAPDFWQLRDKLFAAQNTLTREKILEIATSSLSISRPALESCMASADTMARLQEDIRYVMVYRPTGTPTVTVNGKLAPASGPFLYVLAMTAGNPDAPALASLPPPASHR